MPAATISATTAISGKYFPTRWLTNASSRRSTPRAFPTRRPPSPWFPRICCGWKARAPAPCCGSAKPWKSTTMCRACTPTSISMRRSWRRCRSNVRVLGIDCGSARTGYGVIESDGRDHHMVAAGVIRTSTAWPFEKRLLTIATGLRRLMQEQTPEFAAVEEVFYSANVKTALKLAHVRGVALLTIAEAGVVLAEYSPLAE